jgi:hypothetical protein
MVHMDKIHFDRSVLGWIAANNSDAQATTSFLSNAPLWGHGFTLAMVHPGDDLSDLKEAIQEVHPSARVLEVTAPEPEDLKNNPLPFLNSLLDAVHAPTASPENIDQIASVVPSWLCQAADFIIIYHAEMLGVESLHWMRRDKGMPPVILIAYDERILGTLQKDLALIRYAYFFNLG